MTAISTLVAIAAVGAQSTPNGLGQSMLSSALGDLGATSKAWIRIEGSDQIGTRSTAFASDLFVEVTLDAELKETIKVECREYKGTQETRRYVGDGANFWDYDIARNEYRVMPYANLGQGREARGALFQSFASAAQGPTSYLARLALDSFANRSNRFVSWLPSGTEYVMPPSALSQYAEDPVLPSRQYASGPSRGYILVQSGDPRTTSIAFEIVPQASAYSLSRVFFAQYSVVKDKARMVDWTMTVVREYLPEEANFRFLPPRSAKPLVTTGGG